MAVRLCAISHSMERRLAKAVHLELFRTRGLGWGALDRGRKRMWVEEAFIALIVVQSFWPSGQGISSYHTEMTRVRTW